MAGIDGQKAPKTSGKNSATIKYQVFLVYLSWSVCVNKMSFCLYRFTDAGVHSVFYQTDAFSDVFCQVIQRISVIV